MYVTELEYGSCTLFGSKESDPVFAPCLPSFHQRLKNADKLVRNAKSRRLRIFSVSDEIRKNFASVKQNDQYVMYSMLKNDMLNKSVSWVHCAKCNSSMLRNGTNPISCSSCNSKSIKDSWFPVWKDEDDNIHNDLPEELKDLSLGEKLLIQKKAVLLPVVHLKNKKIGLKGHTVMFDKAIEDVCLHLPRKKVDLVYVLHEYTNSKTSEICHSNFKVRKNKVLDALHWLKRHHDGYSDIVIDDSNVDWIDPTSDSFLGKDQITDFTVVDMTKKGKRKRKRKHDECAAAAGDTCTEDADVNATGKKFYAMEY